MRPLALLLLLVPASALAEERPPLIDTNPPYVQVVVTACPAAETPLEPINQGQLVAAFQAWTLDKAQLLAD